MSQYITYYIIINTLYLEIFGVDVVRPSVSFGQALQGEFQNTLELLRLFAFGTYPEYKAIGGVG